MTCSVPSSHAATVNVNQIVPIIDKDNNYGPKIILTYLYYSPGGGGGGGLSRSRIIQHIYYMHACIHTMDAPLLVAL